MSRNAGSVSERSRSAIASLAASIPRWIQRASVDPAGPNASAGGGSNVSSTLSSSRATIPDEFGGWVVTRTPRYSVAIGSVQVEVWSARSSVVIADPAAAEPARLPLAEVAVVEVVEADLDQPLEGRREGRQPDPLAGRHGRPCGR